MRGFRLSGWQRIGIVASVAWAIGAWGYTSISFDMKAGSAFSQAMEICVNRRIEQGHTDVNGDCFSRAQESRAIELRHKNETLRLTRFFQSQ